MDYVKETQEHQYSRGYWVGKVRKNYHTDEEELPAFDRVLYGSLLIIIFGVILGVNLASNNIWNPLSVASIVIILFRVLMVWWGIKQYRKQGGKGKKK